MKLSYGQPDLPDFESLLWAFPDKEFRNLTRSTIPLLFYWADREVRVGLLCEKLGIGPGKEGTLCFEYPVKSTGRNKPSFTDVMYMSRELAIAIEAKSTEPQYESVEDWLRNGKDIENRRSVIQHWIGMIRDRTRYAIKEGVELSLVYQMVHRMASLCSLPASHHAMVYQHFEFGTHTVDYEKPLRALRSVLDPGGTVAIFLHSVHMSPTRKFNEIRERLETTNPKDRPFIVRNALLKGDLFEICDDDSVVRI